MAKVATYECWCCGGRIVQRLGDGERARPRLACGGFCRTCGDGQCMGDAGRVATERLREAPVLGDPILGPLPNTS